MTFCGVLVDQTRWTLRALPVQGDPSAFEKTMNHMHTTKLPMRLECYQCWSTGLDGVKCSGRWSLLPRSFLSSNSNSKSTGTAMPR